jgi:aryl-alcohol dehydrogenase-like predicted oxidoreductase
LAGGILTGKYASGNAEDARYSSEMMQQLIPDKDRTARLLDALQSISKQTGRSKAQIALAWLRYRPVPVIPIIGARKISQLQDNIASLEVSLAPEQVALLDEASKIDLGFPHDFYAREMVRTYVYGGLSERILA